MSVLQKALAGINMTFARFLTGWVLPASFLLIAAFWCGAQANPVFALTGFLGCFLIAVSLLIEGWKRFQVSKKQEKKL